MPWTTCPTTRTDPPLAAWGASQERLLRSTPRFKSRPFSTSMTCLATKSAGASTVMVASALESSIVAPDDLRS